MIRLTLIAALLLPAIPVTAAWLRLPSGVSTLGSHRKFAAVLLVLQSAALLHILLAIFNSRLLGPDYSRFRYSVIGTWLVISVFTALFGIMKNPIRWLLIVAGIFLAIDWFYIGVVSSVV